MFELELGTDDKGGSSMFVSRTGGDEFRPQALVWGKIKGVERIAGQNETNIAAAAVMRRERSPILTTSRCGQGGETHRRGSGRNGNGKGRGEVPIRFCTGAVEQIKKYIATHVEEKLI